MRTTIRVARHLSRVLIAILAMGGYVHRIRFHVRCACQEAESASSDKLSPESWNARLILYYPAGQPSALGLGDHLKTGHL
jgi:hypothetical protein